MGDQEHCEADSDQSTDSDQPEGTHTTGRGENNALAVVNNSMGQIVVDLVVNTVGLLNVSNVTILISKDSKGANLFAAYRSRGSG